MILNMIAGGNASLITKTITENGTYDAIDDSADGYSSVTVNVQGGGGVPLVARADWRALTVAQKQAYGLVAIQDANSGYTRGELVNGADYTISVAADYTPTESWNSSNNAVYSYAFANTTPASLTTRFCLGFMSQNGANPAWESSLPEFRSGSSGNGNYAIVYGEKAAGSYASSYSGGNNWNNSEIVCFCLSGDCEPDLKELFYEQGQTGTYTYTYQATKTENLLLVCMRGGSVGNAYTISGLTQKSHVTSSGARFNDVYYGTVNNGDTVSISIPYAIGNNGNGSLFVALIAVSVA